MPIMLWNDASKTFEDVNDGPPTADEIAKMRLPWRQATPEQRVVLKAMLEAALAKQEGRQQ